MFQTLASAKMLLHYSENGNLTDDQLEVLTSADYKMYMRVLNSENSEEQMTRAGYMEHYAEQVIENLEGEDDTQVVQPVKVAEKRVAKTLPVAKQSIHQRAWGAWTKKMASERKAEIQDYKATLIADGKPCTAPHLKWISAFANAKSDTYKAFLSEFS